MFTRAREIILGIVGPLKAAVDDINASLEDRPVGRCFCGGTIRHTSVCSVDIEECDRCGRYE